MLHNRLGVGFSCGKGVAVRQRQVSSKVPTVGPHFALLDDRKGRIDVGDAISALFTVLGVEYSVQIRVHRVFFAFGFNLLISFQLNG